MLSMLLLLAVAPQSVIPALPDALSASAPQPGPRMRVIGETPPMCRSEVTRAVDRNAAGADLTWREGGEPVGLYRLLDRRVNGCSAPIIVNYRVQGSNALGREMGRDPAPLSSVSPRP